ncbi:Protein arginine N-methyltransferase 5 [Boothiomyces sp. JEL0838]|nr:Protein arginine N-methyltransferase 5 [Boothiomyces sp. JEL0838]
MLGLEVLDCSDSHELVSKALQNGYRFAVSPILHPNTDLLTSSTPFPASLNLDDIMLKDLDLDCSDSSIRKRSELLVKKQIEWANHLGLSALVFYLPAKVINFARVIHSLVNLLGYTQVLIKVDANNWEGWNKFRMLGGHSSKIQVALSLDGELKEDDLKKWLAEPIYMLTIPSSQFLTNKKGFPVLSKMLQRFFNQVSKRATRFTVSLPSFNHPIGIETYQQYLNHLLSNAPEDSVIDKFATGYHDYLQMPLQPLMDNLVSATYEVFEKDPVKYQQYEEAIYAALIDRHSSSTEPVIVMVVGAGRGPLVDRALKAGERAKIKVALYAIEKNSNAIITLRERKQKVWGSKVEVVHIDMRFWNTQLRCDILVSELLGSFGESGISIPASYTSFISPLSSTTLYNNAVALKEPKYMETPYVVKFRDTFEIAPPVSLWTFEHPFTSAMQPLGHPDFNTHNTRYATATFDIQQDSLMHGFAAYFESILYKDVTLSINPATHSPDMTSWFPMYFPIKNPVYLPSGSKVVCSFWRLTTSRKVWYEWCVIPVIDGKEMLGMASSIHNKDGESYWIGL